MSDAGDIAGLTVQLHEERVHDTLESRIAELIAVSEQACAEAAALRGELESHLTTYHAPEPEPEPEPEPTPAPEPEPEPEPEPAPDVPPTPSHFLMRPVGHRE